jgi:hypothetical protein
MFESVCIVLPTGDVLFNIQKPCLGKLASHCDAGGCWWGDFYRSGDAGGSDKTTVQPYPADGHHSIPFAQQCKVSQPHWIVLQ